MTNLLEKLDTSSSFSSRRCNAHSLFKQRKESDTAGSYRVRPHGLIFYLAVCAATSFLFFFLLSFLTKSSLLSLTAFSQSFPGHNKKMPWQKSPPLSRDKKKKVSPTSIKNKNSRSVTFTKKKKKRDALYTYIQWSTICVALPSASLAFKYTCIHLHVTLGRRPLVLN